MKIADSLKNELKTREFELHKKAQLLCNIAEHSATPEDILFYAQSALQIAKQINDYKLEGTASLLMGDGYKLKGDLIDAINFYLNGIRCFERCNSKSNIAIGLLNLGGVYRVQGNYENASKYYSKSIQILSKENDTFQLAAAYNNLGETYRMWHKLDNSLIEFRKAHILFSSLKSDAGIAYTLGNIGLVYAAQNKNDSAEFYINQATKILEELGDRYPIAVYQTYMADIYKDRGDAEMALKYAHNSLQIAKEEGLKEQIRDASLKLSELYYGEGDYKKAYDYQYKYLAYRDSINNEDVIRKMADLRTEYEISKKQIEVDLLAQKNKTQTVINYGLGAVVLLMATFAFIIYQNSRKRKKLNLLLSDQKEEIAAQRDQLEELLHMKDRFFGIISHDLRSPVNSLQGITQLLDYYVKKNQIDQVEEFVSLADKAINNLASLLDNLLNWALSQQGSLPYRPETFKYYYVAEEVRRIFSNTAASKRVELLIEVSKDIEIYADRDGIFALTRNLINNAIKFTREKGTVSLQAGKEGAFVKIVISDTGIGIQKDKIDDLFVFDKQKSTKGTAGEKGSGLGLALCKDIIELNGGEIVVESSEGMGTKFSILLPTGEHALNQGFPGNIKTLQDT